METAERLCYKPSVSCSTRSDVADIAHPLSPYHANISTGTDTQCRFTDRSTFGVRDMRILLGYNLFKLLYFTCNPIRTSYYLANVSRAPPRIPES